MTTVQFNEGDWVLLSGLTTEEYNGRVGQISGHLNENGRYPVRIALAGRNNKKSFLLKPDNLAPVPPSECVKVVRLHSRGERQPRGPCEDVLIPRAHPMF
jgi:hypothetical protein